MKIDVKADDSFNELLNEFGSALKNSLNHTSVDVENYLDENVSYYSIYNFNCFNENIHVYTGEYSAFRLNIYENSLELIYNCDLFSDVYVEHMAKNIESLINHVLSSPNLAMGNVDVLCDEEKTLLSDYCKGKTIEVEDKMLSESFRKHALVSPDAIAVDDGVNQITYGELEKSSNSIANDLYENHNIGPGSRVGLMLHRDYHFPELVLALNKIGAAYIPIDLLFPANRIGHMLTIAEATHLITTEAIAQSLNLNMNIISIEDLNNNSDVDVEILTKGDGLLAILFTSGTTGIPKGVMFHNNQVPWFSTAFSEMFDFAHGDVLGSYFSFSFVASFMIFVSLYLGGSVRLFNENEQKNSLLLIKALKETHINNLILPPAVGIPIFENEDLNLDYLILAGAKLNELSKKDRHTKLVNFYGTTEVLFAISKIYDLNDIEDDRVPIGRPVANTWAYILDENGNQMPIEVPGEICISSEGITQGYYNDSQSTSKVYVDNPFCDSKINKRMYCTGDIGFYNFDGEIEIIGRDDDQLSVRGFRVESKEILTIMRSFKEISDIYLDVDYDNLVAYYTTIDELDINEVKDALKTELPYYMIPSLFIELDEIPLNINGKIDKTSLKVVTNNENIEISDDVISCVVDAFKEVLNQDVVLIDDDFVSLGGNSLSAMKLQLLLKEKLAVSLSSNELIDLSTPQDIANHIKFNLNIHSTVDEEKANRFYSVANVSVVSIGIIITILGFLFPDMIIGWLSNSATPNIYALDYFRMYNIGVPFFCFMLSMFYYVGTDGMPEFTSKALIIASILDPLFDVILIYFFHMGMAGSGLATSISFIGGSLFLSLYFFKPNRTFKLVKVKFATFIRDFLNVCKSGFGGASVQLYLVISTLFCNSVIISLMGDAGLMSQEICTSILLIISIFFIGLVETASPILSVYHQDKDYSAIGYLINISVKFIAVVGVIFAAVSFLFPNVILMLYSVKMQYASMVTDAVRLYGLSFLTLGFAFFYIFYTQSIQKNKLSNIVSISYNLIIVVAMLIILPKIFGNNGVWITQFCVGVITLTGIVIYSKYLNKKSNGEYHGIFINKSHGDNVWEFTINANASDVEGLVSLIKSRLGENKFSDATCLSLEEFLMHIVETNEGLNTIDVLLDVDPDCIKVYIKDLGAERGEGFAFKNDDLAFNRKLDQASVIGLNSTLITIND